MWNGHFNNFEIEMEREHKKWGRFVASWFVGVLAQLDTISKPVLNETKSVLVINYISRKAESVGTLTHPFYYALTRWKNTGITYLKEFLPNAIISIHNNANETFPQA
jgi:hypothetical protein